MRHGAASVTQVELLPKPPSSRPSNNPWPQWPTILRTSSSHEEGCERQWNILTKEYIGDENGNLKSLRIADIVWDSNPAARPPFKEVEGSERIVPCELALLAVGFLYPQKQGLLEQLGVELDARGNVKTKGYQTSIPNVFAAGDMRRGQSLVVWAISEGREAAREVDAYLTGLSLLGNKDQSLVNVER